MVSEGVANVAQFFGGQAIAWKRARSRAEDLREIHDGVARDGEGEFGLAFARAFDADHDERASVENCGERSDPGLIVVLRTKVGEHGIGEVAFHQLGAPMFPVFEEIVQGYLAGLVAVAAEKFAGGGRRACAGVEKGDIHFAFGEGAVDEGKVTDDGGEKTESETGFGNDEGAGEGSARDDVTETKREKSGAAEIDVCGETSVAAGEVYSGAGAVLHQAEAEDESDSPDCDEQE